jgi:hypothetical protein
VHVLLWLINSNKSRLDVGFAVCEDGEGALGLIGALVHQIDLSNGSTRLNQTFTLTFYHFLLWGRYAPQAPSLLSR